MLGGSAERPPATRRSAASAASPTAPSSSFAEPTSPAGSRPRPSPRPSPRSRPWRSPSRCCAACSEQPVPAAELDARQDLHHRRLPAGDRDPRRHRRQSARGHEASATAASSWRPTTSKISAVTRGGRPALRQGRIHPDRMTVVLVGNASAFPGDLKKKYGEFEVIPTAELDLLQADLRKPKGPAAPAAGRSPGSSQNLQQTPAGQRQSCPPASFLASRFTGSSPLQQGFQGSLLSNIWHFRCPDNMAAGIVPAGGSSPRPTREPQRGEEKMKRQIFTALMVCVLASGTSLLAESGSVQGGSGSGSGGSGSTGSGGGAPRLDGLRLGHLGLRDDGIGRRPARVQAARWAPARPATARVPAPPAPALAPTAPPAPARPAVVMAAARGLAAAAPARPAPCLPPGDGERHAALGPLGAL